MLAHLTHAKLLQNVLYHRGITPYYMNMFIEFIPLSMVYNLHASIIQIWHVHSWHARVCQKTVVHTSSAYIRALKGRFDVINVACTRKLAHV